ncbi:MAG: FtsQ-type POTRA domain-containing protein [Alphaproteobacteria bacterium]|nr:FtsQ-type POTRA domain-containing protein [Alphaproteobacteria bacterium]
MRFFKKKSDDSRSRRSSRLRMLQVRGFAVLAVVLAAVAAIGFAGYQGDTFKKFGDRVTAQALEYTAAAGFKVKDILVTGRVQIPADELLAHLSIKKDMPVFGVDIAEAQKSLTAISWVKDVAISRRLPDTIVVALQERTPTALWQYQKKISLIDQEGVVLTSSGLSAWQSLPLIVGEDAARHVTELTALLNAEPAVAGALVSATWVGKRRWDLRLKNGIAVKLPERDVELALRQLAALDEQKKIFDRNIAAIDLRQADKVVIKPVAVAAAVPAKMG